MQQLVECATSGLYFTLKIVVFTLVTPQTPRKRAAGAKSQISHCVWWLQAYPFAYGFDAGTAHLGTAVRVGLSTTSFAHTKRDCTPHANKDHRTAHARRQNCTHIHTRTLRSTTGKTTLDNTQAHSSFSLCLKPAAFGRIALR